MKEGLCNKNLIVGIGIGVVSSVAISMIPFAMAKNTQKWEYICPKIVKEGRGEIGKTGVIQLNELGQNGWRFSHYYMINGYSKSHCFTRPKY